MRSLFLSFFIVNVFYFSASAQVQDSKKDSAVEPKVTSAPLVTPTVIEEVEIDRFAIKLLKLDDKCQLQYKKGDLIKTLDLEVNSECSFVKWKVKRVDPKYGQIIYQKNEKLMIHKYAKLPEIMAKVIGVYGGVSADESCRSKQSAKTFQLIFIKNSEILTGVLSQTYDFHCFEKAFEIFIAEPDFQFRVEKEIKEALKQ